MKYLSIVRISLLLSFVLLLSYCTDQKEKDDPSKRGIALDNIDSTYHPGDDFYQFVNGKWLENNSIPPEQNSWGSFNVLSENNNELLRSVLENAINSGDYAEGSDAFKAALYYQSGMDSTAIEERGMEPLQKWLDRIDAVEDFAELQSLLVDFHLHGISAFFGFYVSQDLKEAEYMRAYMSQGGLSLPDRDYYVNTDAKSEEIKEAYRQHLVRMFKLIDVEEEEATSYAQQIFDFEYALAAASNTRVQNRDPYATYNKMGIPELSQWVGPFDFQTYFAGLGVDDLDSVIVRQPDFFKELNKQLSQTPLEDLKIYLTWHLMSSVSSALPYDFVKAQFDFYSTTLSGTEEMRPRWKRMIAATNGAIGEALGKLYVDEVFPPEAKKNAQEMVDNILEVMGERIQKLDWMSEDTKVKALEKLATFTVKIGYPDEWKDYSEMEIEEGKYFENRLAASQWSRKENLKKLGKKVDPNEWFMTPPTVNAYYSPSRNEIVFPAGILQPPFYDYQADAAVNYGGIGAVIGHEITHGFDDRGRQYDAEGNLKDWWTEEDNERFTKRAQRVVEQFNGYRVLDTLAVNGELTLGENIADLGGLTLAFHGLQKHFEEHGRPDKIGGFTPEQRFFMAWAQVWKRNERPETTRQRIITDSHSPAEYRTNGPLTNLDEFMDAFEVRSENELYTSDSLRIKIW